MAPGAVGKSMLLRRVAGRFGRDIMDLDDLPTRQAVRSDPGLFIRRQGPIFIDEFQHVPSVLDAMKAELNIAADPGRFVITGSTQYTTLPTAARALTGRAHRIDIKPLSQGEVTEVRENFVDALIADPAFLIEPTTSRTSREEYIGRVATGGFPMALRRARASDRARWFDDYIELVLERDVLEIARVRQRQQLPRLLRQFASQTDQVLSIANAAAALGMEKSTAESYTKLLEAVFLVQPLQAWGLTLGSRVAAAPKIHIVDSGLAARLLRVNEGKLGAASASALTQFGHLLETFVVGEVSKQLDWVDEPVVRGHWRTHDGDEVDLVVERSDGKVSAIEVKAGSRMSRDEVAAMLKLRKRLGRDFLGGVILHLGSRAFNYDDRIHVIPIDRLWAKAPKVIR